MVMKNRFRITSVAIMVMAIEAVVANGATLVLQQGTNDYHGAADNVMYSGSNGAKNAGGSTSLQAGITSGLTSERRSLFRFDVSSLAGQYTSIQSVKLILTGTGSGSGPDFTIGLFQVTDANSTWVAGTGNFVTATNGESCWAYKVYDTVVASRIGWAGSAGLKTAGTDYVATALDTATYLEAAHAAGTTYDFDISVELLEKWITGTNAGLLLMRTDLSVDATVNLCSAEWATVSQRPQLVIEYTPVPEPGTMSLVIMGIAIMGRRYVKRFTVNS